VKSLSLALLLFSGRLVAADKALTIVRPVFAASEDGPPEASDEDFVPGETIYFTCQAQGYRKVDKPDDYGKQDVSLSFQIEVRDKSGTLLIPIQEGKSKPRSRKKTRTGSRSFTRPLLFRPWLTLANTLSW
jgi:hypothetical protein